jgi:hypothetical protein
MNRAEYLGDSVYAQDEGFQITLFTSNGGGVVEQRICLEDTVLTNLFKFIEFNRQVKIIVAKIVEPKPDKEFETL